MGAGNRNGAVVFGFIVGLQLVAGAEAEENQNGGNKGWGAIMERDGGWPEFEKVRGKREKRMGGLRLPKSRPAAAAPKVLKFRVFFFGF